MSAPRLLLAASVVLNVGLALAWWQAGRAAGATPASDERPPRAAEPARAPLPSRGSTANAAPASAHLRASGIASADFRTLHRELTAAGYPRHIIVSTIHRLAQEQFGDWRRSQRSSAEDERPYWKPSPPEENAENFILAQTWWGDVRQQMDELFGPGHLYESETSRLMAESRFGPLPPDKLQWLAQRDDVRGQRWAELQAAGTSQADTLRQLEQFDRETRSEMERRFAAHELMEYDLRHGEAADWLRNQFFTARLTEQEYRTLFALAKPLHDQARADPGGLAYEASNLGPVAPTGQGGLHELLGRIEAQYAGLFGADRAADLLQAVDGNARQENLLATRLGLPLSAAAEVMRAREDVEARVREVQRDETLDPAQRRERLAALRREAEERVTGAFGERGLAAYREFGGTWLQRLGTE